MLFKYEDTMNISSSVLTLSLPPFWQYLHSKVTIGRVNTHKPQSIRRYTEANRFTLSTR